MNDYTKSEINFTHIIDEFSFGEYFPKIVNPLDGTTEATDDRISPEVLIHIDLYRFQYFLSIVPTVYIADDFGRKIIETNQYAVTEQSHPAAGQMGQEVPGWSK
jgi:hypothetical protein